MKNHPNSLFNSTNTQRQTSCKQCDIIFYCANKGPKRFYCSPSCSIGANTVKQPNGCWEWQNTRDRNGYGVWVGVRVPRMSYETFVGSIPEGGIIMHTCDNPPCVNPDHLKVGTWQENMDDMVAKGRSRWIGRPPRLKEEEVWDIFRSSLPRDELARKYSVTTNTISQIRTGKKWSHLTGATPKPRKVR